MDADNIDFHVFDYDEWYQDVLGAPSEASVVVHGKTDAPYVFTDWSRSQLMSHLGVSATWFKPVNTDTECAELRLRLPLLERHRLRRMRGDAGSPGQVRGLVGVNYADIPDVYVLKTFDEAVPNMRCVSQLSGQTDRALYAYVLIDKELRLPDCARVVYPGITIKNSEVGYSSLVICPFAWVPSLHRRAIITLPGLSKFRRIHKGKVDNLLADFQDIAIRIRSLWSNYQDQLDALRKKTYADEDEAVTQLELLLTRAGSRKHFIRAATNEYKSNKHKQHNAEWLLEACLSAMASMDDNNQLHDTSAIAGGLLAYLT